MDGFETIEKGPKRALVRAEWAESVASALLDGAGCVPADARGRGRLFRFSYPGGTGLLRKYQRGGAMRRLVKEGRFLDNRALKELEIHVKVWGKGLPVPEPLGACWEQEGGWYQCAIATRELDSARNLLEYVQAGNPEPSVLRESGRTIRQMHDMGVWHADLQLRNILVSCGKVYLIDFDRARLSEGVSATGRARNLLRLRRSFEKNGVSLALFETIREGYGDFVLPSWLDGLYRLKGALSTRLFR